MSESVKTKTETQEVSDTSNLPTPMKLKLPSKKPEVKLTEETLKLTLPLKEITTETVDPEEDQEEEEVPQEEEEVDLL